MTLIEILKKEKHKLKMKIENAKIQNKNIN